MIPTVKLSQNVLEFGKAIINELPEGYSRKELEAALTLIVTVWNAVIIDTNNNDKVFEKDLISRLENEPKEAQLAIKRLIKRKKVKFKNDLRLVGDNSVKDTMDGYSFICEARLNLDASVSSDVSH